MLYEMLLDFDKLFVIIVSHWRRSSVVEQRNHNPLVRGPNPFAATKIKIGFVPIFYFGNGDMVNE